MFIDRTAREFLSSFRSVIFVTLLKELSKEVFVAWFYKRHAPNGAQNLCFLVREIVPSFDPPFSIYFAEPVDGSRMAGADCVRKSGLPR